MRTALALGIFFASSAPAGAAPCTAATVTSPAPARGEVQTTTACSGCDASGVVTITFTFAAEYECGTFVDGSPWVANPAGDVAIVGIDPPVTGDCGGALCNGWMVNPSVNGQAFDSRRGHDASAEPSPLNPSAGTPWVAPAGTSIIKSVSLQDELVGADCSATTGFGVSTRQCLYFYGVLTVLGDAPPDGTGAGYFRPPYVGTDKPLIPVSEVAIDSLPALPVAAVTATHPSIAGAEATLCTVAVDFLGTYSGQYYKGFINSGEHPSGYQGHVSRSQGDLLLRSLFEDRSDRLVHCIVQRGIDMFHMLRPPVSVAWGPNGGHGQGRTGWPVVAAALLGRADWAAELEAMNAGRFAERSQVYWSPVADANGDWGAGPGEVLYGAYPGEDGTAQCNVSYYWDNCFSLDWPSSGCNRVCADPFNFIDGGVPGSSYQAIFTPAARAYALFARLVPAVGMAWPEDDGHQLFLEYVDRWVDHGAWTLPDPCDADASQPAASSPASCHAEAAGTCVCTEGSPSRYPASHGTGADGGTSYKSGYTTAVWQAFRACADDCSCPGMDGLCDPSPADGGPDGGTDGGPTGDPSTDGAPATAGDPAAPVVHGGCSCRGAAGVVLLAPVMLVWRRGRRRDQRGNRCAS